MNRPLWLLVACAALSCREAPPAREKPAPAPAAVEQPKPPQDHVTLLFTASKAGALVPCGCSPDQKGGLPREVSLVKKLRAQDPSLLYIDAGDTLFERDQRPNEQILAQKEAKARALARGDELVGAAARVVGARDLALGKQFVVETAGNVPLLDAGAAPIPQAKATLLLKAGDVPVGVFAAGLGDAPEKTIAARAAELRAQGARIVVLILHPRSDNALSGALALLPKAVGVDFAVLGRRDDPIVDVNRKDAGPPPLFAVEGDGQSVLRVDVKLGAGAPVLVKGEDDRKTELHQLDVRIERFKAQAQLNPQRAPQIDAKIKELQERKDQLAKAPLEQPPPGASTLNAQFVPITKEYADDAEAAQLVAAYDQRVAEINLKEAQTQPEHCPRAQKGELQFVGVKSCAECHQTQAEFWTQTRHAHAYGTLQKVHKELNLDCIRCHVTGWQQPNGVCRIDRTAMQGGGFQGKGVGRQDVQCEACHGPGSDHAEDSAPGSIQGRPGENVCLRCHEPANSPHFDYDKYIPYIVGPGHGAPLAKGEKPHPKAMGAGPLEDLAK